MIQVVTFRVGEAAFALPADACEALPPVRPTPVPRARGGCKALVDVRGRHVPVLDTERAFGQATRVAAALLVVSLPAEPIALVVDGLEPAQAWDPARSPGVTLLALAELARVAAGGTGPVDRDDASRTLEV